MLSLRPRLKLHIALHTYSQIVIHRWDYRKKKYKDYNKIKKVLKPVTKSVIFLKNIYVIWMFCPKALTKLEERHGKNYLVDKY